jgi:anti-sigma regulatory factor (Ser/Thr protein kinase)
LPGARYTLGAADREREDSKIDTAAPNPDDFLTPELTRLLDTARQVIDQHVNDHGNCADCGLSWPCQRAQLAEFSLGALLTSDRAALGPGPPSPQSRAMRVPALSASARRAAACGARHPRATQEMTVMQQVAGPPPSRGAGTADIRQRPGHGAWSRQLKLAAQPSAAQWARRVLRQTLRERQLDKISETALLLVSELVTNAVKASWNGACRDHPNQPVIALTLRLTDTSLLIEVWDADPGSPVLQEADLTAECGRGLFLVDILGDGWGHRVADGGKVVWCKLAFPAR